jgi:HD-like signal output (HDOD) protein
MEKRREKAIAIVHDFLQSGVDLPFSTEIGPQLLALSSKSVDDIDIDKFVQLVQVDPGLATKVLRLANSVYFSGVSKIASLRRAIVQVGLEEAVSFIHVVFYRKTLPKFPELKGFFSDKDYWSHSWACASACRMLGHPVVGTQILPGELYIAGLLHGIGKLILAIHRPIEFLQCLQNSIDFQQPLPESQLDVFGTTDADIACELLKAWQLPENICMAIKYYYSPEEADKEYREFAGLVQYAYFLANTSGVGNMRDEFCFDISTTWIATSQQSPLADEKVRNGLTEKIYSGLKKKSSLLQNFGGGAAAESTEDKAEENVGRTIRSKPGGWQRFWAWMSKCLS